MLPVSFLSSRKFSLGILCLYAPKDVLSLAFWLVSSFVSPPAHHAELVYNTPTGSPTLLEFV